MSHININCSDLEVSSEWYQRVLGVKPIAPRAEPPASSGEGFGFGAEYIIDGQFENERQGIEEDGHEKKHEYGADDGEAVGRMPGRIDDGPS